MTFEIPVLSQASSPVLVERRQPDQPPDRQSGVVVSISGSRALISSSIPTAYHTDEPHWAVGNMITIYGQKSRIVCLVQTMTLTDPAWKPGAANIMTVTVELLGEIVDDERGRPNFRRGIAYYPPLGATAHRIRREDLIAIYDLGGRKGSVVGTLSQDSALDGAIDIDGMLRKHFAVVGTTGVGKSCAVSILLRSAVSERKPLRVIIVDPHNEYTHAFSSIAHTVDSRAFELPFWLFRFEEIVEVIYRGARAPEEEIDFLRDAIIQAKEMYDSRPSSAIQQGSILKKTLRSDGSSMTADAPQPYRINDILALIDDETGRLEAKFSRSSLRSLRARLESLNNDPSYRFMFGKTAIDGLYEPVIRALFRLADERRPITILQMAGIPADVVNASVSVLARMAFELATQSRGLYEILLMCEEAHRYVPADPKLGFAPTRRSLARIAKEGRKYGCYLGIVTQRPSELDPTILSQCSTVFAMRLANSADQDIIRAAIPDAATGVLDFISALSNREVIAFGEAVSTPMRMMFKLTDQSMLPRMHDDGDAFRTMWMEAHMGREVADATPPPPPPAALLPAEREIAQPSAVPRTIGEPAAMPAMTPRPSQPIPPAPPMRPAGPPPLIQRPAVPPPPPAGGMRPAPSFGSAASTANWPSTEGLQRR